MHSVHFPEHPSDPELFYSESFLAYFSQKNQKEWKDREGATGVSIDTRTLKKGDLFLALKGQKDGAEFVPQAFEKGASYCVLSKKQERFSNLEKGFFVEDPIKFLDSLAQYRRSQLQHPILALTGSTGKTTVKEGVGHVLRAWKAGYVSYGNYNNQLGMPLCLANHPGGCWSVFELGMNRAGEIHQMASLLKAPYAMVTTVSNQHSLNFDSTLSIAQAKAEIFQKNCVGLLHRQDPWYEVLHQKGCAQGVQRWLTWGSDEGSTLKIQKIETFQEASLREGMLFCPFWKKIYLRLSPLTSDVQDFSYEIPDYGEHWLNNSLHIALACWALMVDSAGFCPDHPKIQKRISDFKRIFSKMIPQFAPLEGRGKFYAFQEIFMIDDTYNAAPEAMRAALKALASWENDKNCSIVLGDMADLKDPVHQHQALAHDLRKRKFRMMILCGPYMENLYKILKDMKNVFWMPSAKDVLEFLPSCMQAGDVWLIKGSRSMKMEIIIHWWKNLIEKGEIFMEKGESD